MNMPDINMPDIFERTRILLGDTALERLAACHVVVVGLGGVGGQCTDALARAGVGRLTLIDSDVVTHSNINRQLVALQSTLGKAKTDVLRAHITDINPACQVTLHQVFLTPDDMAHFLPADADFVIDCIDTVPSKLALIVHAHRQGIPVAVSMGAGNRIDPTRVRLADISQTTSCPLARIVRQGLRNQGILNGIPTVYSDEPPRPPRPRQDDDNRPTNGTISYLPPMFGLILTSVAIRHLLERQL